VGAVNWSAPFFRFILLFAITLTAGCSTTSTARKVVALDRFQKIYVESRLNDNHHLDEVFVAELRRLGRDASSGPLTMMPDNTDAILTYDARWEWDFKTYLIELNLELHTVHPRKKIADARYHQPTIRTKTAEDIVRELFGKLFTKT
jgi:hypothetical protein